MKTYSKIVFYEGSPIVSQEDAEAKLAEMQTAEDARFDKAVSDKASAKAKLKAGEALNDAELSALFGE